MNRFIAEHQELVLIGCAILLVGVLVASYGWGIGSLIDALNASLTTQTKDDQPVQVDTQSAQAILRARGLIR